MMKSILLIDDERIVNESLSDVILALGCQVKSCLSIEEALEKMDFTSLDIVICDIGLPGEDPFSFARWLKLNHDHISFIILSALSDEEKIQRGRDAGVDRFILKPTSLTHFQAVFDTL